MEALLLNDELDAGIAFADSGSRDIVAAPLFSETLALVVGGIIRWRVSAV